MLHQVGAGSLGPVFRAHDTAGGRLVAIKAFRLDLTPERAAELAVELEDLAANQPRHPGIAAALAAGVEGVTPYLAQEYVAGEALDAVLRQFGPPPPAEALTTLRRVADGLDRAAGDAIHHGMLHPRDILVAEAGEARVIDLGVAQALIRSGLRVPTRRPYSAPECDGEWSGAADIFSLGAIAFELLTGRRLSGPGQPEVEIPGLTPELNARVSLALARALDADPAARYPSAADLVDALTPLVPTARRTTRRKTRPADLNAPLPLDSEQESVSVTSGADHLRQGSGGPPKPLAASEAPPAQIPERADDPLPPPVEDAPPERGAETVVMQRFDPTMELGTAAAAPAADRFISLDDAPVEVQREREPSPLVDEHRAESQVPFEWRAAPPPDDSPIARRPYLPLAMALLVGVAAGFGWGYWTAFRSISAPDAPAAAAAAPGAPAEAGTGPVRVEDPEVIGERNLPSPAATAPPARTAPAPAPALPPASEAARQTPPPRPAPAPARQSAPGRLTVRSTPPGAAVRIDGRLRGRTPLVLRDMPLRVVRVTVARDGYRPDDRRVALSAARPSVTVDAQLSPVAPAVVATRGTLVVESRPVGATVFVDGQAVGVTPLSMPDLEPGTRRIRLELEGFSPWVTTAQVQAGTRTRVAASLERGTPE